MSRILKILTYQLQVTWNRYEDTSQNLLHYGPDCRAWAGLIREEVLLEIKNSSSNQPGIPSNAINIALEILMSHTVPTAHAMWCLYSQEVELQSKHNTAFEPFAQDEVVDTPLRHTNTIQYQLFSAGPRDETSQPFSAEEDDMSLKEKDTSLHTGEDHSLPLETNNSDITGKTKRNSVRPLHPNSTGALSPDTAKFYCPN